MVAGQVMEAGGRLWRLTLREGLRFHDGTPVLARDCAASVRRWGKRDVFGQLLTEAADEITSPDDRTVVFQMKRPFPLLYRPRMMRHRAAASAASAADGSWSCRTALGGLNPCRSISQVEL